VSGSCSLCTHRDQFLELESGVRVRIGLSGNEQEEISIGRYPEVIAIVRNEGVTECVETSRNLLSAKICSGLGKMYDANQDGLSQLRINYVHLLLCLCWNALAEPELAGRFGII